jgi:hypothetical protein
MSSLGKNGELIPGLSDELAAKGYSILSFREPHSFRSWHSLEQGVAGLRRASWA